MPSQAGALISRLLGGRYLVAGRWFVVALLFVAVNAALLQLLVGGVGWALLPATLVAGEISTLLRFLINDWWVFAQARPNLERCWRFHVSSLGSFALWAGVTNGLAMLGIPPMAASVLGSGSTVLWGVSTNFLWVWRAPTATLPEAIAIGVDG